MSHDEIPHKTPGQEEDATPQPITLSAEGIERLRAWVTATSLIPEGTATAIGAALAELIAARADLAKILDESRFRILPEGNGIPESMGPVEAMWTVGREIRNERRATERKIKDLETRLRAACDEVQEVRNDRARYENVTKILDDAEVAKGYIDERIKSVIMRKEEFNKLTNDAYKLAKAARDELAAMTVTHHAVERRLAEFERRDSVGDELIAKARERTSAAEAEVTGLHERMGIQAREIGALVRERDAAIAERDLERKRVEVMDHALAVLRNERATLTRERDEARADRDALQVANEENANAIASAVIKLENAGVRGPITPLEWMTDGISDLVKQRNAARDRCELADQSLKIIRRDRDVAEASLEQERKARADHYSTHELAKVRELAIAFRPDGVDVPCLTTPTLEILEGSVKAMHAEILTHRYKMEQALKHSRSLADLNDVLRDDASAARKESARRLRLYLDIVDALSPVPLMPDEAIERARMLCSGDRDGIVSPPPAPEPDDKFRTRVLEAVRRNTLAKRADFDAAMISTGAALDEIAERFDVTPRRS